METKTIRSLPAFAVSLRRIDQARLPASQVTQLLDQPMVPFYQIDEGDFDKEVASAAHTVAVVADKLRRLASAYGEWNYFDAHAFFDLYPAQVSLLLSMSERVSTVHVSFYADLLLPSFQRMEQYWAQEFVPAYQAGFPFSERTDLRSSFTSHFFEIAQPKLIAYWERTLDVVRAVRQALSDDIGFLSTAGGSEERALWQPLWPEPAARGLADELLPPLEQIPTLTLSTSFPLPAHRQPGRIRRLRRLWARKDWRQRR
ncbi:hypothetical protein GC175_00575 [bacterium]|nr:hypothetical protein [bacterium]